MRKLWVRLLGVLCTLFLLHAPQPLRAQTTGTIRGVVQTGQTALPGVTVEAKGPHLQGARTSVTDAEGRFSLPNLPPGTYTITAKLEGMGSKTETVQLGLDQDAMIKVELMASAQEKVVVTAEASPVLAQPPFPSAFV